MRVRAPGAARHRAPTALPRRCAQRLDLAGAHRPPDRGAAQEHPRRRAGDRRARSAARRPAAASARRGADNEALICARVTQLWQTRMLRYAKLTVGDEIENALSATTSATFLRADSAACTATIEEALPGHRDRAASSAWATGSAATATAIPIVSAETLRHRAGAAGETVLRYYLTEVHELGAELSISATLATCHAGAAGAGRAVARRSAASRRRALPARPDRRLCAAGSAPCRRSPAPRHCAMRWRRSNPIAQAQAVAAPTCASIEARCAATMPRALIGAAPGAADPRGAGVRLPSRHRRPAAELRQARGGGRRAAGGGAHRGRLLARSTRRRARACCCSCSTMPRPLRVARAARVSASKPRASWRSSRRRAADAPALRPRRAAPLHHLAHRRR